MPDVLLWLGIKKIDHLISMSGLLAPKASPDHQLRMRLYRRHEVQRYRRSWYRSS